MLNGINHITLAVSDLEQSLHFYCDTLQMSCKASWPQGAYLCCGELWLCLSLDQASPALDYTHIAFDISADKMPAMRQRLKDFAVVLWKDNKSEGDSLYLLDPDGHKLEIHVGSLDSRIAAMKASGRSDIIFY